MCKSRIGYRNLRKYGIIELAGLITAGGQCQTFVSPGLWEQHFSVQVTIETESSNSFKELFTLDNEV